MLTYPRKPVTFSLMAIDLPVWSSIETAATLYQKDTERFHLLFSEPVLEREKRSVVASPLPPNRTRLLWLDISPYRLTMTTQGQGHFSYRHLLERGVYGTSRYWLRDPDLGHNRNHQLCFRNYTRSLEFDRNPLPSWLRVEYELWSHQVQLGRYVLNLEIHH
jgi:hypothetical protein